MLPGQARMNRLLSILTTLVLALWAGSLAHLVLTVSSLFTAFPKAVSTVAIEAAPRIFFVTERYHLALAILAIALLVASRVLVGCSKAKRWTFAFTLLASILAAVQMFGISPKMDALRDEGKSGGEEFTKLHRVSSAQYMIQMAFVLGAVALLPAVSTGGVCPSSHRPTEDAAA